MREFIHLVFSRAGLGRCLHRHGASGLLEMQALANADADQEKSSKNIYADQSEDSSVDFLTRMQQATPIKITNVLTDNGSQFTDRFTNKQRGPNGGHKFGVFCKAMDIEHRRCPLCHPQTNGMVERCNGRFRQLIKQTRLALAAQLVATLMNDVKVCNPPIPQRVLVHASPVQALKNWYEKKPDLFQKRVDNQPDLKKYIV